MDCIFCRIAEGKLPAEIVYDDEMCLAFRDINPAAPYHVLVIPKKHIDNVSCLVPGDELLIGHIFSVLAKLSQDLPHGFRVVSNTGKHGGQTVNHLHFHLIGGAPLNPSMA